ncbi:unnamed protein product [Taenia asiatica]|uniref:Zw10 kinetochore protein n=1 Tax=Taenia asiatica TaxID=60517 RepID=A0A0R3WBZ0_TAEAS|nr:unnamed protein product [Taenia asiatica]
MMKQLLFFFAMVLYPKLAQCVKDCLAKTSCKLKEEEIIGRSVVNEVEEECLELQTMRQLLFFLAEMLYPQLAQSAKTNLATTPCELKAEEISGKCVDEEIEVKVSELDEMKKLLLIFVEMLYPTLVQCVKTCLAKTSCELKAEEVMERSANEEVEINVSEMNEVKQLLLLFTEMLFPQAEQSVKTCLIENPCELKTEEVTGRSVDEDVVAKPGEVDEMSQLLFFLAEMLYPQAEQSVKTCLIENPCELKTEEVTGRSVDEDVVAKPGEVNEMSQLLLFLAEMLYPQLAHYGKTCTATTPSPLKWEELFGKSLLEEAQVEASETDEMKQLLHLFNEIFYPKITVCTKLCSAKTPSVWKIRNLIGSNAVKEVELEEYEIQKMKKVLLFFVEMLYPRLSEGSMTWLVKTPCVLMPKNYFGEMVVEEVELQECEVRSMKKVLGFFADLLFPQLAHCMKIWANEIPCALKVTIIKSCVMKEIDV